MKTLLELKNISLTYQTLKFETKAISDISITINDGEFISIVGPSGCGKTTIARIFANELNRGAADPYEIDAASNNGVDQVRAIVESANQRSLTNAV